MPPAEEAALNLSVHMPIDRTARGRTGEQVAALFLSERGYRVLVKNQRTPLGELDLVCLHDDTIVVVEVKARYDDEYGSALEAIGPRKAARLRGAVLWWLAARDMLPCRLRFDAVVVDLDEHGLPRTVEHVKDIIGA
jgi:putative endonuclease